MSKYDSASYYESLGITWVLNARKCVLQVRIEIGVRHATFRDISIVFNNHVYILLFVHWGSPFPSFATTDFPCRRYSYRAEVS